MPKKSKKKKTKKSKKKQTKKSKKKSKKKSSIKIKQIKSNIKVRDIKPKAKPEEAEIEEKTEESEEEIKSIGFQNFIKTSALTPTLAPAETFAAAPAEPVSLEDPGLATETSSAREQEEEKENIEQYVIPEDATVETYKEMIREQNRISREAEVIRTEAVDIETLGRERQVLGREAHFEQFHELVQAPGGDEYEVMLPGQTGFEAAADKSTIPFEEQSKKSYVEKMRE
jgi:hypothetical protein